MALVSWMLFKYSLRLQHRHGNKVDSNSEIPSLNWFILMLSSSGNVLKMLSASLSFFHITVRQRSKALTQSIKSWLGMKGSAAIYKNSIVQRTWIDVLGLEKTFRAEKRPEVCCWGTERGVLPIDASECSLCQAAWREGQTSSRVLLEVDGKKSALKRWWCWAASMCCTTL